MDLSSGTKELFSCKVPNGKELSSGKMELFYNPAAPTCLGQSVLQIQVEGVLDIWRVFVPGGGASVSIIPLKITLQ